LPGEEEGAAFYIEIAFAPGFNENEMEPKRRAASSTSLF
jgi:hypothetical protein